MSKKPWWWPVKADADYIAELREDYPDVCDGMSDEDVLDYYHDSGCKYTDTWDHLGDARAEYEKLADAFLALVEKTGMNPEDFDAPEVRL